jgi:transcriptional regulator with XRE-family HTH domain
MCTINTKSTPVRAHLAERRNSMFARYLHHARVRSGLSQRQVASATGLHQSDISQFEQGKRLPSYPQLLDLARALTVSLQWFATGSNSPGDELADLAFQLHDLGITDLYVDNARVPGAFRTVAETIALVLRGNKPPTRIIEALPAVLAWNMTSPFGLQAFADLYDERIRYRLGWLADIALTIHAGEGFPGGCPNSWCLEHLVDVKIPEDLDEDSLGFSKTESPRPPVSLRWRIGYPAPLAIFRERAEHLHKLRLERSFTVSSNSNL